MHWRTQFPPQHASVLAELIAVFRVSLHPATVMTTELPDELPAAPEMDAQTSTVTANTAHAAS